MTRGAILSVKHAYALAGVRRNDDAPYNGSLLVSLTTITCTISGEDDFFAFNSHVALINVDSATFAHTPSENTTVVIHRHKIVFIQSLVTAF